jgi:hypothetical protein
MTTAPMNPLAGPAGPGKYSTRTDNLQMGSIAYGEGVETDAILKGAELSKTAGVRPEPLTELLAPTGRPNEPVTAGIDMGPGVGSTALQMNKITTKLSDSLAAMLPFDTTGEIAVLYQDALARGN